MLNQRLHVVRHVLPGCGSASAYGSNRTRRMFSAACCVGFISSVLMLAPTELRAQSTGDDSQRPIPILSAGGGFITTFDSGDAHLGPLVAPVLLIPIGERWLIESRATFESDLSRPSGSDGFRGKLQKEVDYLQLDFIANPYVTFTVGRFLTPFGIFNERLYPIWIRNLQTDPLVLPIGVGPSNASTGAMARGGFRIHPKINLNYALYFSALSTVHVLDSDRSAGGRLGIYLPGPRLEFGGSFQQLHESERSNSFGFHFVWQPPTVPVDLRGEYARSARGSGYWVESAYWLSEVPRMKSALRHTQIVARAQQFFGGAQPSDSLPAANTLQVEFGANYYIRDDLRLVSSYGRQFTTAANANIWTVGLTYRFVASLAGRDKSGGVE
jgi:hypothetical protein